MEPIILASSSPRRQELLKMLGIPFKVILPEIDETPPAGLPALQVPVYIAEQKVQAVLRAIPEGQSVTWILAADTLIVLGDELIGKPADSEQAADFLRKFSGTTHVAATAVTLYNHQSKKKESRLITTEVTFAPLSETEINWYIETGEWHNAAGGYRLQGLAGCFISRINGSCTGVIGLPIYELYDMLKKQGYSIIKD
ncbi:MAG TPA: septum formation protein Maf [Candidatus Treponema faecavium]|nr:septum formation protein Maf [Candidatus Treponema faecavium]